MLLIEDKIATIVYEKVEDGTTSARVIIPTSVPHANVRAIDVSDLTPDERTNMAALHAEYAQYRSDFMSRAFKFEDWVEHTTNTTITPKWRSFKVSGLK